MSSYLNIYGIPKEGDKPIEIVSYSRSNPIYSAICDTITVAWAGNEELYTDLTTSKVKEVISEINQDIDSSKKKLQAYEKYVLNNPDYIQDIIYLQEYIDELISTKHHCEIIETIVSDAEMGFSGFSKICCNVG